jgi:hypothetical protein
MNMRVFVYRNLRKQCFSIKALEGPRKGRVIAHRHFVDLTDVTFKVSEAGRQRVLRTGHKNVHAGLVGQWDDTLVPHAEPLHAVRYNPRESGEFRLSDGTPIRTAKRAELVGGQFIRVEV